MALIQKKVLSGSEEGKRMALGPEMKLIHEVPQALDYSEIWLYAINNTKKVQVLHLTVNGEKFDIDLLPSQGAADLYGGTGARTHPGDKFEASCDKDGSISMTGWVYEKES